VVLLFVGASLRLRGFGATQRSLQLRFRPSAAAKSAENLASNNTAPLDGSSSRAALTARMVAAAARRSLFHVGCLEQSLTLWYLLRRLEIPSDLRIGTRKSGEQLDAHAWVECNGQALNQEQDLHKHYAAFDEAFTGVERAKK
jgi:hypothetical protein